MEDGKVVLKKVIVDDAAETKEERKKAKDLQPALADDVKMLVTSMIHKDGDSFARVSFMRGDDWAEGIVPGGRIEKAKGFDEEEIEKLKTYLSGEEEMILKQAKGVNPLRNLFELP